MLELDTVSAHGNHVASAYERLVWAAADWKILPAKWRQRLRKRFARPLPGPFDITIEKMRLRLYPAENYCDRVIFGRKLLPEHLEHEALLPYLKRGMVFVDIGANVGSYSCYVGTRLAGDLTLLAFEPHPRTYQKLMFNLKANDLPVENVLNCGVGPARSTLQLWSDGGSNIGHTSMLKAGTSNPKVSVDVDVVPLAHVLAERNITAIDLLKIDVEGFEDQALATFFDTALPQLLPRRILIEIAHQSLWQRDLMSMLEKLGYRVVFKTAENRLLSLDG